MPPEPLYRQVEAILRQRIGATYPVDGLIPPETELAREFKVSLFVIRRALGNLVDAGLLERRRGSGSYVREPRQRQPVRLVYPGALSAKPYPYAELRLMEICAARLEAAGRAYTLHHGALPADTEGPLLYFGPVSGSPAPSVTADYGALLEHAVARLREAGCARIAHFGGPSFWISGAAKEPPPPFWSRETLFSLSTLDQREEPPDALLISTPEQVEAVLAALPPRSLARLTLVAAGYKGDPRRPSLPRLSYLDLDLDDLAAEITRLHLAPEPAASPRLDLWK